MHTNSCVVSRVSSQYLYIVNISPNLNLDTWLHLTTDLLQAERHHGASLHGRREHRAEAVGEHQGVAVAVS